MNINHLPSKIRHLSSRIYHLKSVICHLSSVIKRNRRKLLPFALGTLLILLPVLLYSLYHSDSAQASWWQGNSGNHSWLKRQRLTLVNDNASESLATGTTVAVTVNTKNLVDQGKLQSDCDDLRVVYQTSTDTELTRYLSYPGGGNCATSEATKVYFQLSDTLANNGDTDSAYYMYFDNPQAETPTGTVDAFNTADDSALLVCPFDGTTDCVNGDGTEPASTATGAIRYSGSKSALEFDGSDDKVAIPNSSTTQDLPTGAFTAEAWIYIKEYPTIYTSGYIFGKSSSGNFKWDLRLYNFHQRNDDQARIIANVNNSASSATSDSLSALSLNTWYHIAMTYDDFAPQRVVRIYINGVEADYWYQNANATSYPGDSGYTLNLGSFYNDSNYFKGLIDEFRVSNVIRYTSNFTPQTTPFIRDEHTRILMHFDENGDDPRDSGITFDDSGNGNDGTITSAEYVAGLVGVNSSTSDTGHAAGGNTYVGHEGIFIEEGTINKVTNPSFENSTYNTNWNTSISGVTYQNTESDYLKSGNNSARLDKRLANNPSTNSDNVITLYGATTEKRLAQGFQVGTSSSIEKASLYLERYLSSSRYVNVQIQTDSSGVPSGTPVTNGTSSCVTVNDLPDQVFAWRDFTFTTPPSLTASTQYHLVLIAYTDGSCSTEDSSAVGNPWWSYNTNDVYSSGTRSRMNESSTWSTLSGDFIFSVTMDDSNPIDLTTTIDPNSTNSHTLSAYIYRYTQSSEADVVNNTVAQLIWEGTAESTTVYTDMGGGWYRLSYSAATTDSSNSYGVRVLDGEAAFIDGVQLEEKAYATTYADGSLTSDAGGANTYFWDDDCDGGTGPEAGEDETADQNSQCSSRTQEIVRYPSSSNINQDNGAVSFWYRPNFNSNDLANGVNIFFFHYYVDSNNSLRIDWEANTDDFKFYKASTAGGWDSANNSTIFSTNQWIHVVATWSTTSGLALYINNDTPGTNADTNTLTGSSDHFEVGSNQGSDSFINGNISDFRTFNSALTSTEVADLYYSGLVSHSDQYEVDAFSDDKGQNPIAIYHFDPSAGSGQAYDSSTYGNHLTVTGATFDTQSGNYPAQLTRTLHFDGTDDIASRSAGLAKDFNMGTDNFSLSAWFRHPSAVTGTDTLIAKYDTAGYKLYMNSSGYVCFGIDDGSNSDSTCTTTSYADSNWHQVEAVRDTSALYLYIDGLQAASNLSLSVSQSLNNSANFSIGVDSNKSNYWDGFIDEVYIYPYARSAEQVKGDVLGSQTSASYGQLANDPLTNGLVGYWKMDESSDGSGAVTRTDSSGNGNDATDNSPYAASTNGNFGNGTEFEYTNSEYLSITDANQKGLEGFTKFTFSFWLKPGSKPSGSGKIINKDSTNGNFSYNVTLFWDNRLAISWSTGGWYGGPDVWSNTYVVTSGVWQHVTFTYDGSFARIYINGVEQTSNEFPYYVLNSSVYNSNSPFSIGGGQDNGTWYYLDGGLDEVRIYNRALSPAEVQNLYNWAPGPVGYWKMDEGSWNGTTGEVKDSSGNGNNGTAERFSSSYTYPTISQGKFGKAGDFETTGNPRQRLTVTDANQSGLDITGPITITAWFKYENIDPPYGPTIASKYLAKDSSDDDLGYRLHLYQNGGKPWFEISSDGTSWDYSVEGSNTSSGEWYHIAGVYDGNYLRVYKDGVEDATPVAYSGSIFNSSGDFMIGAGDYTGGAGTVDEFDGQLDDVHIYNYARTPAQIVEDMNAGHPAPGSPVGSAVGHWKFDEGYGDTAYDSSQYGNDGDLADGFDCPDGDESCPTWTNEGKFGKALSFDATNGQYVQVADSPSLRPGDGSWTMSAWASPTDEDQSHLIVSKTSGNSNYEEYSLHICGNTDCSSNGQYLVANYIETVESVDRKCRSNIDAADGNWHHYVAVADKTADALYLYMDGKKLETVCDNNGAGWPVVDNTDDLFIGAYYDSGDVQQEFDGSIDEVQLYNSALTADQVKMEYNQGSASVMGTLGSNSSYENQAASQEYCIPGDTTSCSAPVAEWKLDENTGTTYVYDTSGNGNTGTIVGSMTTSDWMQGKSGSALDLDGADDGFNASNGSTINDIFAGGGTIEAWINPRSDGESGAGQIFSKWNGAGLGWEVNTYNPASNRGLAFRYIFSGGTAIWDTWNIIDLNKWQHIAITYDNSSTSNEPIVYVNGIPHTPEDETPSGTASTDAAQSLYIGRFSSGTFAFDGVIDDIKMYDYIRTPAQIAWDYNRGEPQAWYKFDECQETTAYNSAVNGNDEAAGMNGTITPGSGTPPENTEANSCSSGHNYDMWYDGATGKRNSSLGFDDYDDYVTVTDANPLDLTSGLTISAWVKTNANEADNVIVSKGTSYEVGINADGDVYWDGVGEQVDDAEAKVLTGTWHHIVVTNNDTTATYYVDGVSTGTSTAGVDADNATALRIGYDGTNYFDGLIDEVKIYNYVLTTQQILDDYKAGAVNFGY